MISTDLLLDDIGDIMEVDGDFVEGESDMQHIEDILSAYPGDFRNSLISGAYIQRGINGLIDGSLRRDIKLNLEADNYQVKKLEISDKNLIVDAERNG